MRRLILGLLTASLLLALAAPAHAIDCDGITLDSGRLFTATGSDTPEPNDGFAVTNADGVPMWAFVRNRSLQAIGYPISQRWVDGPFTLQAFQRSFCSGRRARVASTTTTRSMCWRASTPRFGCRTYLNTKSSTQQA